MARCIDKEILESCIADGLLYESLPYHNCIFVGFGGQGEAKYASYRAASPEKIMGDAAGSNKRYSFRLEGRSDRKHIFESAIDMLSYATMLKLSGGDWRADTMLSLGGVYAPATPNKDMKVPGDTTFKVQQLEKQLGAYQSHYKMNAAFSFERLSRYQRDALIQRGIPFVGLPEQIYLPFLGILLQNRFNDEPIVMVDKLTPIAQALFLLLAYSRDGENFSKSEVAKELGVTNTTITRASKQLKAIGALKEEYLGTTTFMKKSASGLEYLELAKPYLINPIQQVLYVKEAAGTTLPDAGETALSNLSMLNPPLIKTKAIWKNDAKSDRFIEVDPQLESELDYVCLEQWKYAPTLFAKDGNVDPISLYCTLRDATDERVEGELEQMMEDIV